MSTAQGSSSQLTYVVEATRGTTPVSPTMSILPIDSHDLDLTKALVTGNEIRADRIPRISRHGNREVTGSIATTLRADDFDALLESLFLSEFDTNNILKIGTDLKYFTFEDAATDIDQYRQFKGVTVSSGSFSISPNQLITTNLSLMGADMVQAQTSLDASPVADSGNQPFDSYSGSIQDGGSPILTVASIDFSVDNQVESNFVVGDDASRSVSVGRALVNGTITAFYEDAALIDKFLDETASSIELALTSPDAADTYTFKFPNVKYNGASAPLPNPRARLITLPFEALYDPTEGTNIMITKS